MFLKMCYTVKKLLEASNNFFYWHIFQELLQNVYTPFKKTNDSLLIKER